MSNHSKQKRDEFISKLVSNCKAILANQIGLPLGMRKMDKIISWINDIEPLTNVDLKVFEEYTSKSKNYGAGTERLNYNKEFLKKEEIELDKLASEYKYKIIDNCFEIIEKYDV